MVSSAAFASFIFSKTELTFHPVIAPPNLETPRSAVRKPKVRISTPITLNAELRPASSLQSASLYLTRPLTDNDAYLIDVSSISGTENPPSVQPANVYSAVDLLAIDAKGTITQIWPSLKLNQLQKPLTLPTSTKAILYLAAERTEQLGISLMDRVENTLFKPEPATF